VAPEVGVLPALVVAARDPEPERAGEVEDVSECPEGCSLIWWLPIGAGAVGWWAGAAGVSVPEPAGAVAGSSAARICPGT
jgi:hypothetical protein